MRGVSKYILSDVLVCGISGYFNEFFCILTRLTGSLQYGTVPKNTKG